jgi:hypothetical protein
LPVGRGWNGGARCYRSGRFLPTSNEPGADGGRRRCSTLVVENAKRIAAARLRSGVCVVGLKRNIVVLLPGIRQLLLAQHGERAADPAACAVRHDHVVDESPAARDEGVGGFGAVFLVRARLVAGDVYASLSKNDKEIAGRSGDGILCAPLRYNRASVRGTHMVPIQREQVNAHTQNVCLGHNQKGSDRAE